MKKPTAKILWGATIAISFAAILILEAAGAFAILGHHITGRSQANLSFSFKSCKKSADIFKPTILSRKWEDNTLVVTGVAFPNCSSTWLFGSYEVMGKNLALQYSPVTQKNMAMACDCPRDVRYEISGLEKADYEVSLAQGPAIEYTSLLYTFFVERHSGHE